MKMFWLQLNNTIWKLKYENSKAYIYCDLYKIYLENIQTYKIETLNYKYVTNLSKTQNMIQ